MRRIRVRPNHIFAVLLASFAVALYAELEWHIARGWLVEKIYGHAPHRIPCKDWPEPQEAEKALADNADRVRALADAGLRLEVIVSLKCACKAQYGVSRDKGVRHSEVKTIIGDRKRLFGIPYEPLDDSADSPRRCSPPEKTPSANSLARADMSRSAGCPNVFAAFWIPAFAGMTGDNGGNDGAKVWRDGAKIVRFSLASAEVRLKTTIVAPPFPVSLRPFAPLRQIPNAGARPRAC